MTSPSPRVTSFFLLVLALASLFWILGALAPSNLMPGLPVAALSFICPGLAAVILTWRDSGPADPLRLLRRAVDIPPLGRRRWLVAALLVSPAVAVLSWTLARLAGAAIPAPSFAASTAVVLAAVFFLAATCEELGWSGYATDPLAQKWGLLRGALILGAVWAGFHIVPLLQAHRSATWIAWWTLWTLSMRVIMVLLYVQAGRSVLVASLFHMTTNLAWQLFPIRGSYFDPQVQGLLMAAIAALAFVVSGMPFGPPSSAERPMRGAD